MLIIASQSFSHSSSSIWPRRTRCISTRASVQSIRIASCSAGISSEKTAAFLPARMAAFSMKFIADARLAHGRAARDQHELAGVAGR